ncbi:MAG: immunoglobulin-like domain-containing protein [Lachnospiraceae bacterium]
MGKKNIIMLGLCLFALAAGCQSGQNKETGEEQLTVTVTPEPTPEPTPFVNDFSAASEELLADYEALTLLHVDGLRGNLYLPLSGEHGAEIVWESSDTDIISDKEVPNENYDATPAGVVTRQESDTTVTLSAYLTLSGCTLKKDFEVTVLAKPEEKVYTDYLFAYFTGNGAGQEAISFAVSSDGFSWETLNNKKPVLTSELGTKGVRDPFLLRSAEGDRFFLIATDLCIAADGDWWKAQTRGSLAVMIWESEDLVHWSEQRMVTINQKTAGCTWAPEAYYDEKTGEYLVFWASRVSTDNYARQRVYYVKTRDFVNFTEPKVWIGYDHDTIDTTVIKEGELYYRFTKYEGESRIILECADSLLGNWTRVESESLYAQEGVEGPCCFALNEEDVQDGMRYALLLDNYGGSGYYMMVTADLKDAVFEKKKGYTLPRPRPRHGTVISLTKEEYEQVYSTFTQN